MHTALAERASDAVANIAIVQSFAHVEAEVGATGSGQSTIALLYRAFDPQSGRVLIDGVDVRSMTLESLRRNIGIVFQKPMLFARTIRENVAERGRSARGGRFAELARAQFMVPGGQAQNAE